jgi:hypothetical protein
LRRASSSITCFRIAFGCSCNGLKRLCACPNFVRKLHEAHGVTFHLGETVRGEWSHSHLNRRNSCGHRLPGFGCGRAAVADRGGASRARCRSGYRRSTNTSKPAWPESSLLARPQQLRIFLAVVKSLTQFHSSGVNTTTWLLAPGAQQPPSARREFARRCAIGPAGLSRPGRNAWIVNVAPGYSGDGGIESHLDAGFATQRL